MAEDHAVRVTKQLAALWLPGTLLKRQEFHSKNDCVRCHASAVKPGASPCRQGLPLSRRFTHQLLLMRMTSRARQRSEAARAVAFSLSQSSTFQGSTAVLFVEFRQQVCFRDGSHCWLPMHLSSKRLVSERVASRHIVQCVFVAVDFVLARYCPDRSCGKRQISQHDGRYKRLCREHKDATRQADVLRHAHEKGLLLRAALNL
jgi:hypothetical protein